jgi:hypothetical protein
MFRGPPGRHNGAPVARGLLIGGIVGTAVAGNRAQKQQAGMQAQQQDQQITAAQAQADAAAAAASGTYVMASAQPVQMNPGQTYAAAPAQPVSSAVAASQGQQMLQTALSSGGGSSSNGSGNEVAELVAMKKQLEVVQLECQQALQAYQTSFQMQKKAQGSNVGALLTHGGVGTAFDFKRDQEMKRALMPAEQASAKLVDAFKRIPNSLRLKYPTEMARVGDVPTTKLAVGSFGMDVLAGAAFGRFGDTMNDIHRQQQIKQNERQIQQCMAVVQEQLTLMRIVQGRLDSDIANAQRYGGSTATASTATPAVAVPVMNSNPFDSMSSMSTTVPPPIMAYPKLILIQPHVVDEASPAMKQHNIISVQKGAIVDLLKGDLHQGLGGAYGDYVQVQTDSGKSGKISRHVVQPAPTAPPPAAIGAVPVAIR